MMKPNTFSHGTDEDSRPGEEGCQQGYAAKISEKINRTVILEMLKISILKKPGQESMKLARCSHLHQFMRL